MGKRKPASEIARLEDLNGIQKSAILMIALDADTAAEVIKNLEEEVVEKISAEITQVRHVPSHVVEEVLEEFYSLVTANEFVVQGGLEYAQAVLEKSFGVAKAMEIIEKIKAITSVRGFDVLKKADSTQLVNFLQKEHPQTIALILAHLPADLTAEAIKELPEEIRADVIYRIAKLGKISPQILKQIEKVVDETAGITINQQVSKLGGPKTVASILNRTSVSLNKEIISQIEEKDEETANEIKRLMFLFDDIVHLTDKDIQRILKEVDRKDLSLALKIADDAVKDKIFNNMSERAAELLKEELQFMGPVKLKEVEQAQARIVDVIKTLEEQEEITISFRGGSEEVYV
jgi:flagellar motor switch protein FliG